MGFFSLTGETKSQHELSRPQVDVIKQHVSVDKIISLNLLSFHFYSLVK